MNRSGEFLKEFDTKMQFTRRLLERVPTDRGEWKPHPPARAKWF